jgi:hypothetical protein
MNKNKIVMKVSAVAGGKLNMPEKHIRKKIYPF